MHPRVVACFVDEGRIAAGNEVGRLGISSRSRSPGPEATKAEAWLRLPFRLGLRTPTAPRKPLVRCANGHRYGITRTEVIHTNA